MTSLLVLVAEAIDNLGPLRPPPFSLIGVFAFVIVFPFIAGVICARQWRGLLGWAAGFSVAISLIETGGFLGPTHNYRIYTSDWANLASYVMSAIGPIFAIIGLGIAARKLFERIGQAKTREGKSSD